MYPLIIIIIKLFFAAEIFTNKFLLPKKYNLSFFKFLFFKIYKIKYVRNIYFNQVPYILNPGKIEFSENSSFGENTKFYNHSSIKIGQNFLGAPGISFITGSHDSTSYLNINKPIKIGDNCWFGYNVTILQGVEIGNNVTVGACSVVTKDLPDNCVAVGVPAKIKKIKN